MSEPKQPFTSNEWSRRAGLALVAVVWIVLVVVTIRHQDALRVLAYALLMIIGLILLFRFTVGRRRIPSARATELIKLIEKHIAQEVQSKNHVKPAGSRKVQSDDTERKPPTG